MPDIAMCDAKIKNDGANGLCPFAATCYRHKAIPTKGWQSYFAMAPFKEGACERFIPVDGEEVPT